MGTNLRSQSQKNPVLRYSKHPSYGARIFFNDTGYQAHTVVCWFGREAIPDATAMPFRRQGHPLAAPFATLCAFRSSVALMSAAIMASRWEGM